MSLDWLDDPYGVFLDLPAGDRPPHHYELLELDIFCAHRERIAHAVRKQFRRIKPYQDHPDRETREAIQDVMTRIAQAAVALSDRERKETYDCELAERLGIDRERILASRMAVPLPEFALTVAAGPTNVGNVIELLTDSLVTVGRDPHCVIPLYSLRVGMLHGQLRYRDRRWWYRHMDKQRLTLINDERVTQKELESGDRLEVGGYVLCFWHIEEIRRESALDRPPITLIVTRGPSVPDAIYSARAPEYILIGECETSTWQLAGPQVSRHHCRILYEENRWIVVDLQSTNGTVVNGKRVGRCPLADHDVLTIGQFQVMIRVRK